MQTQFEQAVALQRSGQTGAAAALAEAVLAQDPGHLGAVDLLSFIAYLQGDHSRVVTLLGQALQRMPHNVAYLANRGLAHQALGQSAQALADFEAALKLAPDHLQARFNRGLTLQALARDDAALADYHAVLARDPRHTQALAQCAQLSLACGRHAQALTCYDALLALAPEGAEVWRQRGRALKALGRLEEALASHDRALALQPDLAEAHNSRGIVLKDLQRHDEALAAYDRALALQPHLVDAHTNRGVVYAELGQLTSALAAYDRALAIRPDDVDAAWNKALALLLEGQLEAGWPLYEQRWRRGTAAPVVRPCAQALWLGATSLQGKTILLLAEQGLGDTLQMCRYIPDVAALGARVVLERPVALAGLLDALPGVAQAIDPTAPRPPVDAYCPLMSLPLALGATLQTIPASPASLRAAPDKVAQWSQVLGARRGLRVGLVWSGNPRHPNDRQRSLALSTLLAALPAQCDYVSLQQQVRASDQPALTQDPRLRHFGAALQDFSDTAALCALMDVVISVDTSVAHLAGALGRPTWVLLPHVPDWRWLRQRTDSPWYPSMRLFRQGPERQWAPVLQAVVAALSARFEWPTARSDRTV